MVSANAYRAFQERFEHDVFLLECFDTTRDHYWLRWCKNDGQYHLAIIPRDELMSLWRKYGGSPIESEVKE